MSELCVLARHAESTYNVASLVNGDPSIEVALSPQGVEQARTLGQALRRFEIDVCLHSCFPRTLETARLALAGAASPAALVCEPLLGDIGGGEMEGRAVRADHGWRCSRVRDRRPPGGESIKDAALRIAAGLRRVASRPEATAAVITHELIVRYSLNAIARSADISQPWREIPHATPFAVERETLVRAADTIEALACGAWGRAVPGVAANGG